MANRADGHEACRERQRVLEAELRSANEFRSLLLTAIAHDVRTPLTAIVGFASLLVRGDADAAARDAAGEQIAKAAETLRKRVDDLFEVASIDFEGLPREQFDLRTTITAALDGVDAFIEVPLEVPPVLGDDPSARRVIEHLVETCAHLARGARVALQVRVEGDVVCIAVSDERTTFDPADLETLFERFFGLPGAPNAPESGVGLYVAKRLAEAQGGELLVVPREPTGVTFLFTLPVAPRFAPTRVLR